MQLKLDSAAKISLEKSFSKSDAVFACLIINGKLATTIKNSAWTDSYQVDRFEKISKLNYLSFAKVN